MKQGVFIRTTVQTDVSWKDNWLQRVFRARSITNSKHIGLWRHILEHAIAGGLLGFLVLHPLSMIAHYYLHQDEMPIWNVFALSFSSAHTPMAVYFIFIGSIFGLVHGSYIHIISKLNEEVRKIAISDELTLLYNRRFLIERLDQEVARAKRYQHCLAILMIDIDSFKLFNDTYGHPAGDDLLRSLGQIFRGLVRESDFAARYGGEEFVIVMPETDGEMALGLARRICAAVADYPFKFRETQPGGKVTISIGLSELPSDAQTLNELIKKADHALYKAKTEGKNRVCKYYAGEHGTASHQETSP